MQTILGADQQIFVKKLNIRRAVCIIVALVMVALNVLFTLLRNDHNHTLMLILNIVVDVLLGWFLVYFATFYVVSYQRILKLYQGNKTSFKGQIVQISVETQRVQAFDCYEIVVGKENSRVFFLPDCFDAQLTIDSMVTFKTVSNIIVEVQK